jgi:cysteine desulfurase
MRAMMPFFSEQFANAGAIHAQGQEAKSALTKAREEIASVLRVRPAGVIFTGSGTESNNIALLGCIAHHKSEGREYSQMEVVTSAIEHASILSVCSHLESLGVKVHYLVPDTEGIVSTSSLESSLTPNTVAVALGYVNSEIGVVQPITKLARVVRAKEKEFGTQVLVHVDAAQAPLWLPCALDALLCDTLSLDAGKCYGPKGVGVLAMTHNTKLAPTLFGGGQETGLRAGTENIALIVGAVASITIAQKHYKERVEKVAALRDGFFKLLLGIDGVVVNGSRTARVANNVHISIPGVESEFAVVTLSRDGIDAATKSACGGAKGEGSSVVRTLFSDSARALSTIRFTLGEETTLAELSQTVALLSTHVEKTKAVLAKLTQS